MDDALATHFGHVFSRDPLLAFKEDLHAADISKTQLSDGLASNLYQSVRFKMPRNDAGFLIEFRPMEAQISDNAAFAVFTVLLSKTILAMDLNFYVPLMKVEENITSAIQIAAATRGRFWFSTNWLERATPDSGDVDDESPVELFSADEIINGPIASSRKPSCPGIIPLIKDWMASTSEIDAETARQLSGYLDVVSGRAAGTRPTDATCIRQFVRQHPSYKHDSSVPEDVVYDLIRECLRRVGIFG